jgi:hypothetical protein
MDDHCTITLPYLLLLLLLLLLPMPIQQRERFFTAFTFDPPFLALACLLTKLLVPCGCGSYGACCVEIDVMVDGRAVPKWSGVEYYCCVGDHCKNGYYWLLPQGESKVRGIGRMGREEERGGGPMMVR